MRKPVPKKSRIGAKTKRLYDVPRTPYDRVLEAHEVAAASKAHLRRQYQSLDPVDLLGTIRQLQDELWVLGYRDLPSRREEVRTEAVERVDPPAADPLAAEEEPRTFHKTRRPQRSISTGSILSSSARSSQSSRWYADQGGPTRHRHRDRLLAGVEAVLLRFV